MKVTGTNEDITYHLPGGPFKTIHHQVHGNSTNSTAWNNDGDSGGPVYSRPSNLSTNGANVTALGMMVAHVDNNPAVGWFTPVSYVLDAYGDVIDIRTI